MKGLLTFVFVGVCLAGLVSLVEGTTTPSPVTAAPKGTAAPAGTAAPKSGVAGSGSGGGNGSNSMTSGSLYKWMALLITSAFISKLF